MGYTTELEGELSLDPRLTIEQLEALSLLHDIGTALPGRPGKPNGYCQWQVQDFGRFLRWDKNEKFCDYVEWLEYVCEWLAHEGVKVNGALTWSGEERDDRGVLTVRDNVVTAGKEQLVPKGRTRLATARAAFQKIVDLEGDDEVHRAVDIAKAALKAIK